MAGESLQFTADSEYLITSTARNPGEDPSDAIAVWDFKTGRIVARIPGPRPGGGSNNNMADAFSLNPKNGDLAVIFRGPHQNGIGVYDKAYQFRQTIQVDSSLGMPTQIAFSPDGKTLAVGTIRGKLSIYDASDYSLKRTIAAYQRSLTTVEEIAFSPDGKLVATGPHPFGTSSNADIPNDCVVNIWDVQSGELIRSIATPGDEPTFDVVKGLSWSPDGRYLAVSSFDRMARIWNIANAQPPLVVHHFPKTAWSVAFNPDGRQLAASGTDGLLLFDLNR